ncbi:unnamed protein product [marine sediment metagenome]|uniref:Uncharacterized protein n=1 Tax=marine sediment metagenome TaxID=412755 RepID=X0SNZ2_9ZZZZ
MKILDKFYTWRAITWVKIKRVIGKLTFPVWYIAIAIASMFLISTHIVDTWLAWAFIMLSFFVWIIKKSRV